jgi:hypothetical protein
MIIPPEVRNIITEHFRFHSQLIKDAIETEPADHRMTNSIKLIYNTCINTKLIDQFIDYKNINIDSVQSINPLKLKKINLYNQIVRLIEHYLFCFQKFYKRMRKKCTKIRIHNNINFYNPAIYNNYFYTNYNIPTYINYHITNY